MHTDLLPMNAASLMDRVFTLYAATIKTQIAFSLIIGTISFILMMALGIFMAFGVLGAAVGAGGYLDDRYLLIAILVIVIGIMPLYMIWVYLSASGHILISKQAFYGEPHDLPFREVLQAFLRIMSAALAQLLLSVPWLLILFAIIYSALAGRDVLYFDILFFVDTIHPAVIVVAGLVYTLFYVVYSNIFALSIPVALFEKRVFLGTVTRSFQLLKGDFWRILGLRILWTLLVYLFSYSAQGLVMAVTAAVAAFAGAAIDMGHLMAATAPLQFYASLFVGILVGPMEGIMTALIYFNQKIKQDGLDIGIMLSRLARGSAF